MKMKYLTFFSCALLLFSCGTEDCDCGNEIANEIDKDTVDAFAYDSVYAESLGADDYGMKPYVMAFLKTGPNTDLDSAASADLQAAHMENINSMAEEGKLVLAGPFYGDEAGDLRGIYIFDASMEEALELTNSDPAVQEGVFIMDLVQWYGSAALSEVNNLHKKAAKIEI